MKLDWRLTATLALVGALSATPVVGATIDVRRQDLAGALRDLRAQTGVEILYASADVVGGRSGRVRGRMSVEAALDRILDGTGLVARRSPDGVFVLVRAEPIDNASQADTPVVFPEVLVIGKRTLNGDLVRLEDGIQPFVVRTARDVALSQANDIGGFVRDRVPAETSVASPTQVQLGGARSEFDLLGFGPDQTLVLIDGRRLPRLPDMSDGYFVQQAGYFAQPDVNALPLGAVERIETVTASAGGIYGLGALGGVVNVVLARDYHAGEISALAGISTRDDAGRTRLEGRFGFSPDGGTTEIQAGFAVAHHSPLRAMDRNYTSTIRARSDKRSLYDMFDTAGDGRNIMSDDGSPLVTDSGRSLESNITTLPLRYATGDLEALLVAGAGRLSLGLGPDATSGYVNLLSAARSNALTLNIRRPVFGVETYLDFLRLENEGRGLSGAGFVPFYIDADAPTNPFQQAIRIRFPMSEFDAETRNRTLIQRFTLGAIIEAPRSWRLNLDAAFGQAESRIEERAQYDDLGFYYAINFGVPAPIPGAVAVNPFGDYDALRAAVSSYRVPATATKSQSNRLINLTARTGGPVARAPGGDLIMTVVADLRDERLTETTLRRVYDGEDTGEESWGGAREQVASLYGEANLPLRDLSDRRYGLAGLELQASGRIDRSRNWFPATTSTASRSRAGHDVLAWTAGARVFPVESLMLRASAATGALAPSALVLARVGRRDRSLRYLPDPERPGDEIGDVTVLFGGLSGLEPERARSFSAGLVWRQGASRVSLDYTRVRKWNGFYGLGDQDPVSGYVLNPDMGQVIRAPLTPLDATRGYTVGRVISVESLVTNSTQATTQLVSMEARRNFHGAWGGLDLQLSLVWQPSFRRFEPDIGWNSPSGDFAAPLKWRGYGGATWTKGVWTAAATGRFGAGFKTPDGRSVSPQLVFDLVGAWRSGPNEVQLGVRDLLDSGPRAFESRYGTYDTRQDPRRRRVELAVRRRY